MAVVEGQGCVAPAPKPVNIDGAELEMLKAEGHRRAKFQGYQYRPDAWGRGNMRKPTDPTFYGMLGEFSFAKWINAEMGREVAKPDLTQKKGGDGGIDFTFGDLTIDVKCSPKPIQIVMDFLLRRIDNGRICPLNADVYFFVCGDDPMKPAMLGWAWRDAFKKLRRSPVPTATHWNVLVDRTELNSVNRLAKLIDSKLRRVAPCR